MLLQKQFGDLHLIYRHRPCHCPFHCPSTARVIVFPLPFSLPIHCPSHCPSTALLTAHPLPHCGVLPPPGINSKASSTFEVQALPCSIRDPEVGRYTALSTRHMALSTRHAPYSSQSTQLTEHTRLL